MMELISYLERHQVTTETTARGGSLSLGHAAAAEAIEPSSFEMDDATTPRSKGIKRPPPPPQSPVKLGAAPSIGYELDLQCDGRPKGRMRCSGADLDGWRLELPVPPPPPALLAPPPPPTTV